MFKQFTDVLTIALRVVGSVITPTKTHPIVAVESPKVDAAMDARMHAEIEKMHAEWEAKWEAKWESKWDSVWEGTLSY